MTAFSMASTWCPNGLSLQTMLELEKISKSFGLVKVLSSVSLKVSAGESSVIIGPSGCGKTTLVRVVMGLVSPDRGEVRFNGEALTEKNMLEARRQIGYVVQGGALFPHMTAGANVTLMPKYIGWGSGDISEKLDFLSEMMDLPREALTRYPNELSGGQRQRVSLMRALMLDPEVLVLDEPFGALDPIVRFQLQKDLRALFRKLRKTLVMVTHDISEAAFFGDQIILMRAGTIVQQGPISDFLHRPKEDFVKTFVAAQRALFDNIDGVK